MATQLIGVERNGDCKLSTSTDNFTYSETYKYLVYAGSVDVDYWEVITTAGLPLIYITEQYGLRCTSKSATRDPMVACLWHVTAEFTSHTTGQDPGQNNPDPDPQTWIPIWTGTIDTFDDEPTELDYTDDGSTIVTLEPFLNSAGTEFPSGIKIKHSLVVYEFSQYESDSISDKTIADRNECINDAGFLNFGKWTLKCNVSSFTRGRYFGYKKVLVNYKITYKPRDWTVGLLDVGYEYFEAGVKKSSPTLVALNSDGTKKGDARDAEINRYWVPNDRLSFSSFIRTH